MATSPRSTTPIASPEPPARPEPVTPQNNLRNRWGTSPQSSPQRPGEASPSSTTASSGNISRHTFESNPSLRQALQTTSTFGSIITINLGTPVRKLIVRADPSIVTCFDPADKELYDLWAPKR